jgi:parallel beta-helix repeat protein
MGRKFLLLFLLTPFLVMFLSTWIIGPTMATGYTDVAVSDARTMVESKPSLVILDVRNQSEYYLGHIRNAKLIPVWDLSARLNELNVSDEILVYCEVGARSAAASQTLVDDGFLHVYNMLGGITAWANEGYPVYVRYPSIQEAINGANEGDTVFVSSGLYVEHLAVNKSLTLIGENEYSTIIDGTDNGTIFYVTASNVSISDFTIQYCGCSCQGYCGIDVGGNQQNVNITNNNLASNGYGIKLDQAQMVLICNNTITGPNRDWSILVSNSSTVLMLRNNVTGNLNGIEIENCSGTIVSGNTVLNSFTGIFVSNSNDDTFSGNTLSSNKNYGIYVRQSSNNTIFHNSFLGNTRHVLNFNSVDFWDNGAEGNYWSNYTGVDSDFDGIGETSHVLDANNTDHYPLMGLFSSFSTSLAKPVNVISNSTIESFEYFESNSTIRMHVSNMTENQTFGFVRISIPHVLMNDTYKVLIDGAEPYYVNYTLHDNGTHRWIYFAYEHSTLEIVIVPESPTLLILPLFMTTTLLAVIVYRRKHTLDNSAVHLSEISNLGM